MPPGLFTIARYQLRTETTRLRRGGLLGYDEGETVDGLFIQDALDDDHIVDPVFMGGLPTMEGSNP
ncbi:MAG: hypothetical protein WD070_11795 [Pirellulaceae bacterium]